MIRTHEKVDVDLAHLPADDPKVYAMLNEADTVGCLPGREPRADGVAAAATRRRSFYDLVVQVAIIRPGPIVGGMVHPFFDRRQGKAPVEYPHPVPRADPRAHARRAALPGAAPAHRDGRGGLHGRRGRGAAARDGVQALDGADGGDRGAAARGHGRRAGSAPAAQDQIVKSITSFALYGFPESHAASFALIAYASAYLKAHHPAAFLAALLNCWPMGFYHPATLVKDAQRHGVDVRPIDVGALGLEVPLGGRRGAPRPALRRRGCARRRAGASRRSRRGPPSPTSRTSRGAARCGPTSSTLLAARRSARGIRADAPRGALAGRRRSRGRRARSYDDAAGRRPVAAARDDAARRRRPPTIARRR